MSMLIRTQEARLVLFGYNAVLDHIAWITAPSGPFYIGSQFSLTGGQVMAYYKDGSTSDVTAACTFNPIAGTRLDYSGEIPVTATYTDKQGNIANADTAITVFGLVSIEVTTMPDTTVFTEDDPYDYTGIVVTAHYSDGSTAVVTNDCVFSPAAGTEAVLGTSSVNVTYAPCTGASASTSFAITVKKKSVVPMVKAIQLLPTTFEESLASIRTVMSIPNKMMQRINSKRSSVFGNQSLNLVLCAGWCNYPSTGSARFALMDITPWVNQEKYIYNFGYPATGVSQGARIPSEYPHYTEFIPHMYYWENCIGNNIIYTVADEGEVQEDGTWMTPWASDLCIGFGSDVYSYNPFPQTGGQPYQALAANYMIVDVPDPSA